MSLKKKIQKAMNKCRAAIAKPFTREGRHKVENQYEESLSECARMEYEALTKLNQERETEHNKIEQQRKKLEEDLKATTEQFKLEQEKINQYFQEKEKYFKDTFEQIVNNFKFLKAGLYACVHGRKDLIEPLFKKGMDLKLAFMRFNPIYFAAGSNQSSIIELLAKLGANINQRNRIDGNSALDIAQERMCEEASNTLKYIKNETDRLWKAYESSAIAEMKLALEKGAAINATFPDGSNLLQKAIYDKKPYELIRLLIDAGAVLIQFHELDCDTTKNSLPENKLEQERKMSLESNLASSYQNTQQFVQSKNIFQQIEKHPDSRVIDYFDILYKISREKTYNNIEMRHAPVYEAIRIGAFNIKEYRSEFRSTIVNVKGSTYYFNTNESPYHYQGFFGCDLEKNLWNAHPLGMDKSIVIDKNSPKPIFYSNYRNRNVSTDEVRDKYNKTVSEYYSIVDSRNLLQNYTTNAGKIFLVLLARNKTTGAANFIQFDPENNVWKIIESNGPYIGRTNGEKLDPTFRINVCEETDEAESFLFFRTPVDALGVRYEYGKAMFWSYKIKQEKWQEHVCPFGLVTFIYDIQFIKKQNKSFLYAYICRYEPIEISQSQYKSEHMELWAYDLNEKKWLREAELSVAESTGNMERIVTTQMNKVQVNGETKLFIYIRFQAGMQVYCFDPLSKSLELQLGGPNWKWPSMTIVSMKVIQGSESNSDIILFFNLSKTGIECIAYHPLYKKWLQLHIPEFLSEHYIPSTPVDIHVSKVENQYKIIVFSEKNRKTIEHFVCPINILSLEEQLKKGETCLSPSPIQTYSENEISNVDIFFNAITLASNKLLQAAKAGDWSALFTSLDQGADVHSTNERGENALQLALQHQIDQSTLKRLLSAGIAINFRHNLHPKSILELTRAEYFRPVHDYLAVLLDKPLLSPTNSVQCQFRKVYLDQYHKASAFINMHQTIFEKCRAILNYFRLLSKTNPYAIYVWPAMLFLGEILNLPIHSFEQSKDSLLRMIDYIVNTHALYKALCSVNIQDDEIIKFEPTFNEGDWTHVVNILSLKKEAQIYADSEGCSETDETVLHHIFNNDGDILILSMYTFLQQLSDIMDLDAYWIMDAATWLSEGLKNSRFQLRETFNEHFKEHFESLTKYAKQAYNEDLFLPAPKPNLLSEIKILEEHEKINIEQLRIEEQNFLKEKRELELWLLAREKECHECIEHIKNCIQLNDTLHPEIEEQFKHAVSDINNHFANYRKILLENKEKSLRKMEKKAFKSIVVMVVGCCVACYLGPVLATALGGSTALGLSAESIVALETVFKGAISGGFNGGFSGQNIMKSMFKGAFSSTGIMQSIAVGKSTRSIFKEGSSKIIGQAFGSVIGNVIDPNLSEMNSVLHTIMTQGLTAAVTTKLQGGNIAANVFSNVTTNLLLNKMSLAVQSNSPSFLVNLRTNLTRALVCSGVSALANKRHLPSEVAMATLTSALNTSAEYSAKKLQDFSFPVKKPDLSMPKKPAPEKQSNSSNVPSEAGLPRYIKRSYRDQSVLDIDEISQKQFDHFMNQGTSNTATTNTVVVKKSALERRDELNQEIYGSHHLAQSSEASIVLGGVYGVARDTALFAKDLSQGAITLAQSTGLCGLVAENTKYQARNQVKIFVMNTGHALYHYKETGQRINHSLNEKLNACSTQYEQGHFFALGENLGPIVFATNPSSIANFPKATIALGRSTVHLAKVTYQLPTTTLKALQQNTIKIKDFLIVTRVPDKLADLSYSFMDTLFRPLTPQFALATVQRPSPLLQFKPAKPATINPGLHNRNLMFSKIHDGGQNGGNAGRASIHFKSREGLDRELSKIQENQTNLVNKTKLEILNNNTNKSVLKPLKIPVSQFQITHGITHSKRRLDILTEKIKSNGIIEPIEFIEQDGIKYVVNGHHRLFIAKNLGMIVVPAKQVDLPYLGYKSIEDLFYYGSWR